MNDAVSVICYVCWVVVESWSVIALVVIVEVVKRKNRHAAHIRRMAPAAPTLTREEFVSLRDGAKGLMHRIPFEHKARLIELGYIEEVHGGIRLTAAGRRRSAEG